MIISGKEISTKIKDQLKEEVEQMKNKYNRLPKLAVILVGENQASQVYVRNKERGCSYVGMDSLKITHDATFSEEELLNTINRIKSAGYQEKLILQEYIPGDDSYLFDSVVYVSKSGKVKVISFAQIGLQERSKSMVGNAACLINGFNTFKVDTSEMKENIITFMETLGMNGFFEFDMKYDKKSNTFKVLEINARQGRCSYYLTPLKANLVEIMLKDLVMQEELPFRDLKEECLLSFVPKNIVKTYITNEDFKKEALRLWKKRVSPMECPKDKNFKRFLMMKKRLWHYKKEYQNSYWKA